MNFKHSIGYLLHELAHLLDAESDQVLSQRLGIRFAQFKILIVLEERDEITQKVIARSLNQTEASISRQIKILRSMDLIQSRISPANRRQHIISITGNGLRMVEKAASTLNAHHSPMFEKLSEHQQIQITEALQLIKLSLNR